MRVIFEVDPASHIDDIIRHDFQMWLHFHGVRDTWRITEMDDFDGKKLLTVHFNNSLDAMDFWQWRDIYRRARREG